MKVLLIALSENNCMRGVERYAYETARCLADSGADVEVTMLIGDWQKYYFDLRDKNITFLFSSCKRGKVSRHFYLIMNVCKLSKGYDVVHYMNTLPYFIKNRAPTIMTIHDVAEYFVPSKYSVVQLFYRKFILQWASKKVDYIVTVSEFSKKAIIEKLHIDNDKIKVTYNGAGHFVGNIENSVATESKYILFFGVIERTKGASLTINAFQDLKLDFPELKLVIVGKKGNEFDDINLMIKNDKNILYSGHVDDDELIQLIANAQCVVFPSQYEGFGLPALEAFVYNDNVITANSTALGEVTSKFAFQVDPSSAEELKLAITQALTHPKKFDAASRRDILEEFSWERSANTLLTLYAAARK